MDGRPFSLPPSLALVLGAMPLVFQTSCSGPCARGLVGAVACTSLVPSASLLALTMMQEIGQQLSDGAHQTGRRRIQDRH